MRPALPCSPGNRRPPCDQPHLAAPAIAVHHATSPPCRPGNRRPPVMPPFLHTDPTAAARRRRSLVKQTVVPRSRPRRPSTAKRGRGDSRKGPQLAGGLRREGVAEGRGRGGKGSRREGVAEGRGRGGKGLRKGGTTEGRDYGGEGCNRKARSRIRHGPAESLAEFFRGLCTICKPKYTF